MTHALAPHRSAGWTPEKEQRFIAALAATGSVSAAAAHVGMSRQAVYARRRREEAEQFHRRYRSVRHLF